MGTGQDAVDAAVRRARDLGRRRQEELLAFARSAAEVLAKSPRVARVVLFGSVVGGNADHASDVDVAIIADIPPQVPPHRRLPQLGVDLPLGRGVDVLVFAPEEFARLSSESGFVKSEILAKGLVLYERPAPS